MSDLESESADPLVPDDVVPDDVIPHGKLPPLRYRDLPEPQPLRKMIGPGIVLAGLALGSGEFVLWPYITYRSGFVFFWACILGVTTQYFLNMEITRWTLATGESAITGFCRLSRRWAFIFLALNIIPWMLPAWAKGAARLIGWLIWGPDQLSDGMVTALAIGGLLLCGAVLTMGPVIYETVERIQLFLVTLVLVLVVIIAVLIVRTDAIVAQCQGLVSFGLPERDDNLTLAALLGAIAFAGVGGTLNLGQSNYIKDKGFGMGHYIGRITSPVTGRAEPMSEVGFHFPDTPENRQRWQRWWRAASLEHFISFYCTCLICLILLTLINYSVFYQPDGKLREGLAGYANNLDFIWAEAGDPAGPADRAGQHRHPPVSHRRSCHSADHRNRCPGRDQPHRVRHRQGQLAVGQLAVDGKPPVLPVSVERDWAGSFHPGVWHRSLPTGQVFGCHERVRDVFVQHHLIAVELASAAKTSADLLVARPDPDLVRNLLRHIYGLGRLVAGWILNAGKPAAWEDGRHRTCGAAANPDTGIEHATRGRPAGGCEPPAGGRGVPAWGRAYRCKR